MFCGITKWAVYVQWKRSTKMIYVGFLTNGHIFGIQYYPYHDVCYTLSFKGWEKSICNHGNWTPL
jgi:hypothetical protein